MKELRRSLTPAARFLARHSAIIALLAMPLFPLHPRLYAHSFFNAKDPTFLSVFMIALYHAPRVSAGYGLGVRALRRGRWTARQHSDYGADADSRSLGHVGA